MKEINIKTKDDSSRILIGENLNNLQKYFDPDCTIIITDENVFKLYNLQFKEYESIVIGTGEKIKTLNTVNEIYKQLLQIGVDRKTKIIGIGGGIVCDITGFIGSTFLRGIKFSFIPSTLLAAADASVGGKNGVNYNGYKNLIGTFNQPEMVIFDTKMIKTLPDKEILCGYSEILKHGIILDKKLFYYLKENQKSIKEFTENLIEEIVYKSILIKSGIVEKDEREKGERMKLNFGHTIGHALERSTDLNHGEAIGVGMILASKISILKAGLKEKEYNEICKVIKSYGLPTNYKFNNNELLQNINYDKKRDRENINFVLIKSIGNAIIKPINIGELKGIINDMC